MLKHYLRRSSEELMNLKMSRKKAMVPSTTLHVVRAVPGTIAALPLLLPLCSHAAGKVASCSLLGKITSNDNQGISTPINNKES